MLYREIIAVFSNVRKGHVNTLCGQNVELVNVKLVARVTQVFCVSLYILSRTHNVIIAHKQPNHSVLGPG
jgi:hypothetical protein